MCAWFGSSVGGWGGLLWTRVAGQRGLPHVCHLVASKYLGACGSEVGRERVGDLPIQGVLATLPWLWHKILGDDH